MKKITPKTLKGLEVYNALLKDQNLAIQNNIDLRKRAVTNSLASLSGAMNPYSQTPITSFNPILQNNIYAPLTLDWTILMYAYKSQALIKNLCKMPVLDALRGGINIRSKELEPEEIGQIQDILQHKKILSTIGQAEVWTRLFGGGGLIISTDRPTDEPLDFKQLARDKEFELYACNRWELSAPWRTAPRYNFYGKTLDASRVITMCGDEAPYTIRWTLAGWGMSCLESFLEDFNTYMRVKNVIYELLYEAKVDVYKFKDFASQMLSAEAEAQTNRRMQIMNAQKAYNAALLLDAEDDFTQRTMSFAGIAEIYRESRIELASASKIPLTKLFGLSSSGTAGGVGSSHDDLENYNGMLESDVRPSLREPIKKVIDVICVALWGHTFDIDFEFKPLRVLGAEEEQKIKDAKIKNLLELYDRGLIDESKLMAAAAQEKLVDTELDMDVAPTAPEDDRAQEIDQAELPERMIFRTGAAEDKGAK